MNLLTAARRAFFLARVRRKFDRHLRNGREVWEAFRDGAPVRLLEVRDGPTIAGRPNDEMLGTFLEIFVDGCYLRPDFYRPSKGDTIVDLGANIGIFALQCAWAAEDLRVIA